MQDIETLLSNYLAGPRQLAERLAEVSEREGDARPVPGQWTIRQLVCHLADFEIVYADRMKRVLAEDNPTMFGGDPDQFAASLKYEQRRLADELAVITAVRQSVARMLSGCDVEAFQRTGVHNEAGPMTLETLLENVTTHIPHHLTFLDQKLERLRCG